MDSSLAIKLLIAFKGDFVFADHFHDKFNFYIGGSSKIEFFNCCKLNKETISVIITQN
jgi:hypothetical protein